MTGEPSTPAQKRAFTQGKVAYLAGESIIDNPHMTDTAFRWWRRGWKAQEQTETAGQDRCPYCKRLLPQQEETR